MGFWMRYALYGAPTRISLTSEETWAPMWPVYITGFQGESDPLTPTLNFVLEIGHVIRKDV